MYVFMYLFLCIFICVFVYYVLCHQHLDPVLFQEVVVQEVKPSGEETVGGHNKKVCKVFFSLLYLSSSFKDSWQLCTTKSKYFCQFRASVCLLSFCDSNIEHECQLFRLKDVAKKN